MFHPRQNGVTMLRSLAVALRVRIARRRFNQAVDDYAIGIRLAEVADNLKERQLFLDDLDPMGREVAAMLLEERDRAS